MAKFKYNTINAKIQKIYEQFCAPVCKKYDINQTAFDILLFLGIHPDRNTARDICDARMMKSSLLSVTIEKLIQAGYLKRERDALDRRVQHLLPSESSAAIIADCIQTEKRFEAAIFKDLSEQESEAFANILQKISQTLEHLGNQV